MRLEEAKKQVLELITRDVRSSGLSINVDPRSPDNDLGKLSINGKTARVVAPFDGFFVNISLDWFSGFEDLPVIQRGEFYYYVFALTDRNPSRVEYYYICDFKKLRNWVLEFDAPEGNDHRDHFDWRGAIEYIGERPYSRGYFRWGEVPE